MTTTRSSRSRSAVTRRRFLGHLGAVGGSSIVMTALSSWDLMAGEAGKRPALSGRPRNAKVLVPGGAGGVPIDSVIDCAYDSHGNWTTCRQTSGGPPAVDNVVKTWRRTITYR